MKPTLARTLAVVVGWALLGVLGAHAADSGPGDRTAMGLTALEEGRFGEARRIFRQGVAEARASGEAARLGSAHFYLGLVDQQQAPTQTDPNRRSALLSSALAQYRRAIAAAPESAGVLNNMARVQWELGQTNAALASLSQAVALNDPRRGFYTEQYADLLLQAGRWRDACRFYAVVAGEQPQNRKVHRKMVDACMRHGPDLLGWYLWELARSGQVLQVQDHVLQVVADPAWSFLQRAELMGLLAYCLARKNETPQEWNDSPAGRRIRELVDHPEIGPGAKGLVHLYAQEPLVPENVRWWTRLIESGQEPHRGIWPYEAFLELVRSLGDRAGADGNLERKEQFYLFAVAAKPGAPDPEALLGLANLYSERGETAKIQALLQRHQVDIFEGKGQAYSHSQTETIYRYHMALGVIYSQLEQWKTPGVIDSALFQLNRAVETADRLNRSSATGGGSGAGTTAAPVVVPTRLVDLLAAGYEKTGQRDAAVRTRFDQAERYLKIDQPEAAARVMAPLKSSVPPPPGRPPANTLPVGVGEEFRGRWKAIDDQIQEKRRVAATPATGRVQVRVSPEASAVAGTLSRTTLTDAERRTLESAIGNAVGGARRTPAGRGSTVRSLNTNTVGAEVQEVTVTGNQGRVLLRRGTNLVQVPFQVQGGTNRATQNLRLIRP